MLRTKKEFIVENTQKGMVMIIGLMMLLLITIIGLAAVRGTNLQELMAGNMRDRNIAFQTAESGLRVAEESIKGLYTNSFNGNGIWRDLNVDAADAPEPITQWTADQWEEDDNSIEVNDPVLSGLHSKPRYVVERVLLPPGAAAAADGSGVGTGSMNVVPSPDYFRSSSRGTGQGGTSEVVLQSTYKIFFVL